MFNTSELCSFRFDGEKKYGIAPVESIKKGGEENVERV
jgi:hypothetical protein